MERQTVAILAGGYSSEWEISMQSARVVLRHLPSEHYEAYIVLIRKDGWYVAEGEERYELDLNSFGFSRKGKKIRFELAFNAIHGNPGENGLIQGYLEARGIRHTSCSQSVSALTFNKWHCNTVLKEFGFSCAKSILLQTDDRIDEKAIVAALGLPLFVKPNNSGSSFGVSKVKDAGGIVQAIENAWKEDREVIIESFMDGIEVSVGVFRKGGQIIALPPTEIRTENEFFDYEAKYLGKSSEITPAEIGRQETEAVQAISRSAYRKLNASGVIRIDFIITKEGPRILEVNTIPGLSPESIVPKQVRSRGIDLGTFFHILLQEASL